MSDEVRDNTYRHRAKRLVIRNRGQDGWLLTVWDAEAIDTSHLGFRPIQKITIIHASSGFIRGIPI